MLQLRPMSIGDILDESFHLYRNDFLKLLGITAVAQVPLTLILLVINLVTLWLNPYAAVNPWEILLNPDAPYYYPSQVQYPLGLSGSDVDTITTLLMLLTYVISIAQGLVVNLIMIGAMSQAISQRYHGREASLRDAYSVGLRRYWRVLVATLVQMVAIFIVSIGLVLLIWIPCVNFVAILGWLAILIFLMIRWSLLHPVAVLERAGPIQALRRSWRLTAGFFWRTFAVSLLSSILGWVLAAVPLYLIQVVLIPLSFVNILLVSAIQSVVSTIGQILVSPISIGILTLLYYDLRIRKEGYDVELLVQFVEASLPAPMEVLPSIEPIA
jgi:hypothetical protein